VVFISTLTQKARQQLGVDSERELVKRDLAEMADSVVPIELCLESLDPADDDHPYVRCVALAGGQPGLGVTAEGQIVWRDNDAAALLIWVSADNRLIAWRSSKVHKVWLSRAERALELPASKPVVALNGDTVEIDGRAFRIHVHGTARTVESPTRMSLRRAQRWVEAGLVAATLAACHTGNQGNVPTSVGGAESQATVASSAAGGSASNSGSPDAQGGMRGPESTPPIEIREAPPAPMPMPSSESRY
jgi:hypothetical protein